METFVAQLDAQSTWGSKIPPNRFPQLNPKLPRLYKFNQNGKLQEWAVSYDSTQVIQVDGLVDGKLKEPSTKDIDGNTVRTQEEQIVEEAQRRWIEKVTKGYFPHPLDTKGVKIFEHVQSQRSDNGGLKRGVRMWGETKITPSSTSGKTVLADTLKPMLAKKYEDRVKFLFGGKKPSTQVLILQPKLDGKRALSRFDPTTGKRCLESRGGFKFLYLDHITDDLSAAFPKDWVLDGELFIRKLYRDVNGKPTKTPTKKEMSPVEVFQFLGECVQHTATSPNPYRHLVEYWVYDLYDATSKSTNAERLDALIDTFSKYELGKVTKGAESSVKLLSSEVCLKCTDEIVSERHQTWVDQGYEGIMIRTYDGLYKPGVRSNDLMKKKFTDDSEWTIIDAKMSVGGLQDGAVVWQCERDGIQVWAKQMGSSERSSRLYNDRKKYIGKQITLLYNGLTADGVPRFPRAKDFRDGND
jgi:hypothetical protein